MTIEKVYMGSSFKVKKRKGNIDDDWEGIRGKFFQRHLYVRVCILMYTYEIKVVPVVYL